MHLDIPHSRSLQKFLIVFVIGVDILAVLALTGLFLSFPHQQPLPLIPAALPAQPTYHLLFTGDIMLDRLVKKQIQKQQDPLYPFLLIASTTQAADLTISNLEGPVTDRGTRSGSIYSFHFEPAGTINALQFAGFDVVASANNHIFDYGRVGILDTLTHLRDAGISAVGIGADATEANTPVIKILGDTKIAFLSYTNLYPTGLEAGVGWPGISSFSITNTSEAIRYIKESKQADVVVVLFHGGIEYQTHSTAQQRQIARALIDAGADLFIGTHPHVTEEVEKYTSSVIPAKAGIQEPHVGFIAYSLGNFVFDQDFSKETMNGLMAEAAIKDKRVIDFKKIPIRLTPTFQPFAVEPDGL